MEENTKMMNPKSTTNIKLWKTCINLFHTYFFSMIGVCTENVMGCTQHHYISKIVAHA